MKKSTKPRTLNEIRQTKEYGYKPPVSKKKTKERPLAEWEKKLGKPKKQDWAYSDTKVKKPKGIEIDGHKIPDPKLHQQISFIKSGIRILGYACIPFSLFWATAFLILSEVVGIIEELV